MRQHHVYGLLYAVLVALTLALFVRQPDVLDTMRNFAFDTFQRIHPPPFDPASPDRVLAIDETSLARLGQWPWPRTRIAEIVGKLRDMGAAAIVFDIVFAEPDRTSLENILGDLPPSGLKSDLERAVATAPTNDMRFADAIAEAPVVLGVTLRDGGPDRQWSAKSGFVFAGDEATQFVPPFRTAVTPLALLMDKAAGLGATNWLPDRDQIVRQVPVFLRKGEALLPALSVEALRLAFQASTYVIRASNASATPAFGAKTGLNAVEIGDRIIEVGASGVVRPRYTEASSQRYLSAIALLDGKVDPSDVQGRVIFIGPTAIGLGDIRATPLDAAVPGVEVHAQVFESILADRLLSRPDWAWSAEIAVTLVLFLALGLVLPRIPALTGALIAAWFVTGLVIGAWEAFDRFALLLDPVVPSVIIVTTYLCGASMLWQTEQRAKRHVRTAFGKFLAPAVVTRLAENPKLLKLSGETRELTILFSDVRNFSTISETLDAPQVAHFLNAYLTPMTDTIIRFEGTVDKYIGDAIVAFWNAPLDVADHTTRAVDAALAMRAALADFNQYSREHPEDTGRVQNVRMGIGLNVGSCSVGNMGSAQRFDYSALGDPVNVAARLESLTKAYAVDLLATTAVTERTAGHAWLEIDEVKVKGRSALTKLFTAVGGPDRAGSELFQAWADRHRRMLEAGRQGRLKEARILAKALAIEVEPQWRPLYDVLAQNYGERDHEVPVADSIPVGALLGGPEEAAVMTSLGQDLMAEDLAAEVENAGETPRSQA